MELLVVIGIIAVLISVLLPTITAARRQAQLITCSASLRQISNAALLHAHEHKGYMPLAGYLVALSSTSGGYSPDALAIQLNDPYRRRYSYAPITGAAGLNSVFTIVPLPGALAKYMGVNNLPDNDWQKLDRALNETQFWRRFMCPGTDSFAALKANNIASDNTPVGQGTMMVMVTQNGSEMAAWSSNSDYAFNEGAFGYHFDQRYAKRRMAGNVAKMRPADRLVLFTDGKRRKDPAASFMPDPWICWTPDLKGTGGATLADALESNGKALSAESFDRNRHRNRMNIAFADGHVASVVITSSELSSAYLLLP